MNAGNMIVGVIAVLALVLSLFSLVGGDDQPATGGPFRLQSADQVEFGSSNPATTTLTVDSSVTGSGACLKLKKATTSGFTYCKATQQGTLDCSLTSCE